MKKAFKVILAVVCIFAALNLVWFGWRHIVYSQYTDGMTQTAMSTAVVPRYACKDGDGFDYSVKYPDYLAKAVQRI